MELYCALSSDSSPCEKDGARPVKESDGRVLFELTFPSFFSLSLVQAIFQLEVP